MELIFNLIWLAISLLMLGFWLLRTARGTGDPLRQSVGVQLVALALLIVILLPVVSLTDDLHATALLAESDHLWKRCDFQAAADFALHAVSIAIVGLALLLAAPRTRTLAWLSFPAKKKISCNGYLRALGIRPPPAV